MQTFEISIKDRDGIRRQWFPCHRTQIEGLVAHRACVGGVPNQRWGWVVSHTRSGFAVWRNFARLRDARAFVERLAEKGITADVVASIDEKGKGSGHRILGDAVREAIAV